MQVRSRPADGTYSNAPRLLQRSVETVNPDTSQHRTAASAFLIACAIVFAVGNLLFVPIMDDVGPNDVGAVFIYAWLGALAAQMGLHSLRCDLVFWLRGLRGVPHSRDYHFRISSGRGSVVGHGGNPRESLRLPGECVACSSRARLPIGVGAENTESLRIFRRIVGEPFLQYSAVIGHVLLLAYPDYRQRISERDVAVCADVHGLGTGVVHGQSM